MRTSFIPSHTPLSSESKLKPSSPHNGTASETLVEANMWEVDKGLQTQLTACPSIDGYSKIGSILVGGHMHMTKNYATN